MSTFNESDHPREQKSGRFADKNGADMDDDLDDAPDDTLIDEAKTLTPIKLMVAMRDRMTPAERMAVMASPVVMSARPLRGGKWRPLDWRDIRDTVLKRDVLAFKPEVLDAATDEQIDTLSRHWDARVRTAAVNSGRLSERRMNEMANVEQATYVLGALDRRHVNLPRVAYDNMNRTPEPVGGLRPWWMIEAGWAEKGDVDERRYSSWRLVDDDGFVANETWDNSSARRSCIKDPDPIVRLNMARDGYKVKYDDVTDPALRREFEAVDPAVNKQKLERGERS